MRPWFNKNSDFWKSDGSFCLIVCSITRGPVKPISAFGSAIIRSPKDAKLAMMPAMVGFVRIDIKKQPLLLCLLRAADVFAICMSEYMPSYMRAPPLVEIMTTGNPLSVVSKEYKTVQPADVLGFFKGLAEKGGFEIETVGSVFFQTE